MVTKRNRIGKRWNAQEVEFLRTHYYNHWTRWIAVVLGRTVGAIKSKASDLGISKMKF